MRYTYVMLALLLVFTACTASVEQDTQQTVPDTPEAPDVDIADEPQETAPEETSPEAEENPAEETSSDSEPRVHTFDVNAVNFAFITDATRNPNIRVKQGDIIRINLTSTDGFHDFVIDEFGVASEKISEGESTYVEFTADQAGEFYYYCSVGSHRARGMEGQIIVTE